MFICSKNLDTKFLQYSYKNAFAIRDYSNKLIPEELRHFKPLCMNQLYYVCLTMRKLNIRDYKGLHQTIEELFKEIKIFGIANEFHLISEIEEFLEKDRIKLYLERL